MNDVNAVSLCDVCAFTLCACLAATSDVSRACERGVAEAVEKRHSHDNVSMALIVLNQGGVATACAGSGENRRAR